MKIRKLQAGGYLAYQPLPIIPRQGQVAAQPQAVEESTSEGNKDGFMDKDLMKSLLGKGITVDVMEYTSKIDQLSQEYENMAPLERNTSRGKQIRSFLKGDMGMLNGLLRSKDFFDNSMKKAEANKSLDEIAINGNSMFVKNKDGKVMNIGFSDYSQNKSEYKVLTNAELAEEREFNKALVGNTSVYSALNYGKGMELIKDEIVKVLAHLGSQSSSISNGSYVDQQDIQELTSAAQQGTFKVKSSQSLETNSANIEKAKQAMWVNLSENSKNVLRARAAIMSDDPSKIEGMAVTMAASLLDPAEKTSTTKVYDILASKTGAGKTGGGSEKTAEIGANQLAHAGGTNAKVLSQIGDYGVSLESMGYLIGNTSYTDKDGNLVKLRNATGLTRMSNDLSKSFHADGTKVNLDETVITGDAYVTEMIVARDENGGYKIDEEGSKRLAEYKEELTNTPNMTAMKQSELKAKYRINAINIRKVAVAEAASYADGTFSTRDSRYFKKADEQTKKLMDKLFPDKQGWIDYFDKPVEKHLIFIPLGDEAQARYSDGNSPKLPEAAINLQNGFNQGVGGMNIDKGTTYQYLPGDSTNRTDEFFKNK